MFVIKYQPIFDNLINFRLWISPGKKRFWLVVLFVFYSLIGFIIAPLVVRQQLISILTDTLQRPVTIENVRINPYSLSARVQDFQLTENDSSNIVKWRELIINFQLSSIFNRAWTFEEISLIEPTLTLVRTQSGSLNLLHLIPKETSAPQEQEAATIPPLLFHNLKIVEGTVDFMDRAKPSFYSTTVTPVNLHLTEVGTLQGKLGHHHIELSGESGATLTLQGNLGLNPLNFRGELLASGPYFPVAYKYFQDQLNILVDRGDLDLRIDFSIAQTSQPLKVEISAADISINDLHIADKASGTDMLELDSVSLNGFRFAWPDKLLKASGLSVNRGSLSLIRHEQGLFNWQQVLVAQQSPETDTSGEKNSPAENPEEDTSRREPALSLLPDWKINLSDFAMSGINIGFVDRKLKTPAHINIDNISLSLGNLSNQPGITFPAHISANVAGSGTIDFQGELNLIPSWAVKGQIRADTLPLTAFDSYIGNYLNATLASGVLSLNANVDSNSASPLAVAADIQVDELDFHSMPDDQPLVMWQSLRIQDFTLTSNPLTLNSSRIFLDQPYLRVRINEDHTTNYLNLVSAEEQTGEPTAVESNEKSADSATLNLSIDDVVISDGTLDFADYSLPIPFERKLETLNGELSNFTMADGEPSSLTLKGKVGKYGLARITGKLSPWDFTSDTEVKMKMQNIDMPNTRAYSIKFVGRDIAKGRANLNLDYKLAKGKLIGKNDIVLTQFELGEKVPSKDAVDLPLDLAVALMRGPDGKIDIDLPVSGDVNDPEFSVGGVIIRAISNLITKIVTAPFKLLGALVGAESDDFDRVYFEPGSAEITPPELEKLHQLTEALNQRPQLRLEVKGVFSPAVDGLALREQKLDDAIEAARAEEFGDGSKPSRSAQRLQIMEEMFDQAYGNNTLGALKEAYPPSDKDSAPEAYKTELRKRLLDTVIAEPENLEQLASLRAENIVSELTGADGLKPERISTVRSDIVKKPVKEGVPLMLKVLSLE